MLAAAIGTWGLNELMAEEDEEFSCAEEIKQQSTGTLPDLLSIADSLHNTAAVEAMQTNSRLLLEDEYKFTPLMLAVLFGPEENFTTLLNLSDASQKTTRGRTVPFLCPSAPPFLPPLTLLLKLGELTIFSFYICFIAVEDWLVCAGKRQNRSTPLVRTLTHVAPAFRHTILQLY
jgi:hypothetical protein